MNRRLNIVSVCRTLPNPDDPSGGIFVLNRVAAMAEASDLHFVQPIPYLPMVRPLPNWAAGRTRRLDGVDISHAPMLYVPGMLKSADAMWLARSITPILERIHEQAPIDLIDAHFGYPEGAGCMHVAKRLGIPCFITIRGFETEYVHRSGIAPRLLAALREAAGCIAVSHSLKELAVNHGVAPDRVTVVHNAIDASLFHFSEPALARAKLGLTDRGPLIVSVGHLVSRKRHHVLIKAFASLSCEFPEARLVIVGASSFEQSYPAELRSLVSGLGLEGRVQLAGNIAPAQVVTWLQAADVFALATAREGCCNAVLEALAVGVPVVTTPAGDNTHFVEDHVNGYIVPCDDGDVLAKRLRETLQKRWDRRAISERQIAKVGSWQSVGRRVLEFMQERLAQQSALRAFA